MKHTTKVLIPESDKGDQRVIFTDDFLFVTHKLIRVFPSQIMNILAFKDEHSFASDLSYIGMENVFNALEQKMEKLYDKENIKGHDFGKSIKVNDNLNKLVTESYLMHIRSDGLDNRYLINISSKTLQTLSDHIWGTENHREI